VADSLEESKKGFIMLTSKDELAINANATLGDGGDFEIKFEKLEHKLGCKCIGTFTGNLINRKDSTVYHLTDGKFNLEFF
jgi:hypothetical protein